ncbi:MAG: divergent PAP2 family protein [Clostridia bacterium]|nr:divergent PAP2 family protein [Clostridia bacterium]
MHDIAGILTNRVVWCCFTAWFVAQAIKIPTYYLVEKKLDFSRFFGSGGMPSSHTALVVALMIMVGATEGFDSSHFAMAMAFASIVMYDATGVRRETGLQAQILNEILRKVFVDGQPISDDELKELIGHTKIEVAGGVIVGLLTALAFILL